MSKYEPELGQMAFGNKYAELKIEPIGEAAISYLLEEMSVVFWNREQKDWNRYEDPKIPGIIFRPYCWDEDLPEANLPNLELEGDDIKIYWYKYPGRGMSVNREIGPSRWALWLREALKFSAKEDPAVNAQSEE